jgi:arylsulfatase A-like enzyme
MRFGLGRARLAAVLVAVATWILGVALGGEASAGTATPPNFLIVQTDDQGLDLFNQDVMPHVFRKLVGNGTVLTRYGVSTPLCCPSRAALLTGQYGHNNGVLRNGYKDLNDKTQTLASWLQAAGYRTIHLGKFLNHYEDVEGLAPAPGWTDWETLLDHDYYGYRMSDNGTRVRYGHNDHEYVDRVLTTRAVHDLKKADDRPFYLQLDLESPHADTGRGPCSRDPIPDPRDIDHIARVPVPRPPSFNEADVSDKPPFMQGRALIHNSGMRLVRRRYRCSVTTMKGTDRNVNRVLGVLRRTGQIDNTVIFFTSDNGVMRGQHRILAGKAVAYRESVEVPAVIRLPPSFGATPSTIDAPTANIDWAPTVLDLAGASPCAQPGVCRTMDGRSLVGSLGGTGDPIPPDRNILFELSKTTEAKRKSPGEGHKGPCAYSGVRNPDYWYVHYTRIFKSDGTCFATDQREMYDVADDPFELDNLYPPSPANQAQAAALSAKLTSLEECAGIAGRDAQTDGRPYCE